MKKTALILTICSMVVLDLLLSGQSIVFGLFFLAMGALVCFCLDQSNQATDKASVDKYDLQISSAKKTQNSAFVPNNANNLVSKYVSKQVSATFSI